MADGEPTVAPVAPTRRRLGRECLMASVGVLVVLGGLKHLGDAVPAISDYVYTIAPAAQLYVPIMLIGRAGFGITAESLGLTAGRWGRDLKLAAGFALLTIVPFAIGHHFWQTELFHRAFSPALPAGFAMSVANQVLVVALPEELFYRGYLQGRLELLWPPKRRWLGAPVGMAIVVASVVFALAHFVGEYRIDRLGPFFPGLIFGWMRARTGSLVAPVAYHAFCNVLGDVLWACYR